LGKMKEQSALFFKKGGGNRGGRGGTPALGGKINRGVGEEGKKATWVLHSGDRNKKHAEYLEGAKRWNSTGRKTQYRTGRERFRRSYDEQNWAKDLISYQDGEERKKGSKTERLGSYPPRRRTLLYILENFGHPWGGGTLGE